MKKQLRILGFLLTVLLVSVVCACAAQPSDTVATPSSTSPTCTTTTVVTTTAPETTPYAFMLADNFEEVPIGNRAVDGPFRYTTAGKDTSQEYSASITADLPRTVEINGTVYELEPAPYQIIGREVRFRVKDVSVYSVVKEAMVAFDAIDGNIIMIWGFPFHQSTNEERSLSKVERAKLAIAQYLPHIDLSQFKTDIEVDETLGGNHTGFVDFQLMIEGYPADAICTVGFYYNEISVVYASSVSEYNNFDREFLNFDQEEHDALIASFVEYWRNGNEITEPVLREKRLVWTASGRYAIDYSVFTTLESYRYEESLVKLRIYLN